MKRLLPTANDPVLFASANDEKTSFRPTFLGVVVIGLLLTIISFGTSAQQVNGDSVYIKAITERSAKIVNTLAITDSAKYKKAVHTLVTQYSGLNDIHEKAKQESKKIKAQNLPAEEATAKQKIVDSLKQIELKQIHQSFVKQLEKQLNADQVEKVKDGMTYRVFPITYTAYLDMIPSLTKEQQQKIFDWLKEARELAMDAESSDAKHAVFGKYKGRINNYLSAQGYNITKEREEWNKRIQAKKGS
ncbi:MAG TPA: DUF3826 domain-containing protein [Phnomibacter sp.]|nr:DUF3826 domain-containing protein [Phnomibacter sp.]